MSFVNIPRLPRDERTPRPRRAGLKCEMLEGRVVPAANLVDFNSSVLAAGNAPGEVVAATPDGRYAIFQSQATDIVQGQNDTPGTPDLFWIDFVTGARKLVTNAPNDNGSQAYNYNKTTTFGRAFPSVEPFATPVISDDGNYVGFSSKVNAGALDQSYATNIQIAKIGNSTSTDRADTTYDVFRWEQSSGKIQLASRTYPQANGISQAFGLLAEATNPAVSSDGSFVTFVSARDARAVYPNTAQPVVDSVDNTDDLFTTDFTRVGTSPQTTTVVDKIGNPYSTTIAGGKNFFFPNSFATLGFLAQYVPVDGAFFGYNSVLNTFRFTQPPLFQRDPVGVKVDPLGRYLSGDGQTTTFLSDVNALWVKGLGTTPVTFGPAQFDVYTFTVQNVSAGAVPSFRIETEAVPASATAAATTLALTGGSADNAILARNNSNRVLFTAAVSNAANGSLVSSYAGPTGKQYQQMNLYLREDGGPRILVNSIDAQASVPGTSTSATTTSVLPADPLSTDTTNPRVDPRGYQITPDGHYVVFTSNANNLLAVSRGIPGDKNNSDDVFRRNVNATFTDPAKTGSLQLVSVDNLNRNAGLKIVVGTTIAPQVSRSYNPVVTPDGRFVAFETLATNLVGVGIDANAASDVYVRDLEASKDSKTQAFIGKNGLVSVSAAGTAAGNAASTRPVIGGPGGGSGRVLFSSLANNLADGLTVDLGTKHGYVADLPITTGGGGVTGSTAVGVIGGGNSASAALVTFTGNGTIAFGSKFTPFPGFTGEIRVATGDVDGDGVPDIIAGAGPGGGPRVTVISGATGLTVRNYFAFEPTFLGGVTVAAADFNNDGFSEVVIAADSGGGPRVQVYGGTDGVKRADFFAYEATFRGGVRVAAGDVTADGIADITTGAGIGGGPRVSVFDGTTLAAAVTAKSFVSTAPSRVGDYFAFESSLRNGVYVGAGDIDGDGYADVAVGGGPGGGPRVTVFDGKSFIANPSQPTSVVNLFVFDSTSRAGARVAVKDIDGNGTGDLLVGQGAGEQSRVRTYQINGTSTNQNPVLVDDQLTFNDFGSLNGAWVG